MVAVVPVVPVDLKTASNFAILAGTAFTNGAGTFIDGDFGVGPTEVQAVIDMKVAFVDVSNRKPDKVVNAAGSMAVPRKAPGFNLTI